MRLVARVTLGAARVRGDFHLRKAPWFGRVFLVTPAAQVRNFGQGGLHRGWVGGVPRLGAVAGLARYAGVLASAARLHLLFVARGALGLPGKNHGMLADQVKSSGAVVAVLAEVFGDYDAADNEEHTKAGQQH